MFAIIHCPFDWELLQTRKLGLTQTYEDELVKDHLCVSLVHMVQINDSDNRLTAGIIATIINIGKSWGTTFSPFFHYEK